MKKILAILLAAIFMIMACTLPVYADDDEDEETDENEAAEDDSDDENENNVPGFELTFAAGGIIAAMRFIRTGQA